MIVSVPSPPLTESLVSIASIVNLGAKATTNANGDLGGALTITDTGSATTDTVNIVNKAQISTGVNLDVFAGNDLTSTGHYLYQIQC
jgi:hypothetical protein